MQEIFKNAKKNLGANGYELWEIYMCYLQMLFTAECFTEYESLINELARQHHPQFNKIKASAIEFQAMTATIDDARAIYCLFITNYSKCLEVHEMMADLESRLVTAKISQFSQLHFTMFTFLSFFVCVLTVGT